MKDFDIRQASVEDLRRANDEITKELSRRLSQEIKAIDVGFGQGSAEADNPMHTFASGAVRSACLDTRYDLLPSGPLRRLSRRYHMGVAIKGYAVDNWMKGLPLGDTFNHIIDHLYLFKDKITGKIPPNNDDDLAGAAWGVFALMFFQDRGDFNQFRDIPGPSPQEQQFLQARGDIRTTNPIMMVGEAPKGSGRPLRRTEPDARD
jgi:hypothetical protein